MGESPKMESHFVSLTLALSFSSRTALAVWMSMGDWRSPRSATGYHLDHKEGPNLRSYICDKDFIFRRYDKCEQRHGYEVDILLRKGED